MKNPNFAELAAMGTSLIVATVEVSDVRALYDDLETRGADIIQALEEQSWGGTDFHIRDPDKNRISFVEYGAASEDILSQQG